MMKNKDYKFINVKKISGALGAIIEGVDLINEMNDDILKEIKRAFLENLVIFFQNIKFTPEKYLDFAKKFAEALKKVHPEQLLAYNCSPSFNWKKNLDDAQIAKFQKELGSMGYKFQFITLAGFHALNYSMFELSKGYNAEQMTAYVKLQEAEFAAEKDGYSATKHQREVGTGYFDSVTQVITGGSSSVTALTGSTEEEQFDK